MPRLQRTAYIAAVTVVFETVNTQACPRCDYDVLSIQLLLSANILIVKNFTVGDNAD